MWRAALACFRDHVDRDVNRSNGGLEMTTTDHQTTPTSHRPPVRASTLVRSDRAHTFQMFVRTIGVWWPARRASSGHERVRDITIEHGVGGKVFETWDDGSTVEW